MDLSKLSRPGMLSFVAQRFCTWYVPRNLIANAVARRRPQPKMHLEEKKSNSIVQELEIDGYSLLPSFLDQTRLNNILSHLDGAPLSERFGARRSGFTIHNAPEGVHVAEYDTRHLLKCKEIVDLTHDPLILSVATKYLGCKPTMSSMTAWWSLPADGTAQGAENYHRDVDDWKFVKFFIYLTDVDINSGPHRFIKSTHKSSRFLVVRRLRNEEVEGTFGPDRCLTMTGQAGDAFFEDTFGLHKGQPPKSKKRLVLQFQYSINPIVVYDYKPQKLEQLPAAFDAYTARLFMSSVRE